MSVMGHMNITQLSFYKLRQINKKKGARRQTPVEKLSRSIISENTQTNLSPLHVLIRETPPRSNLLCADNDRICQSKAGHGIFSTTRADRD